MIYIFSILLALMECLYQRYQFMDLKTKRNTKWKTYRVITNGLIFLMLYINSEFRIPDVLLAISIYWIMFELLTNKISLNTNWLYVGKSSYLDNYIGKKKWLIMALFLIISLTIKILS